MKKTKESLHYVYYIDYRSNARNLEISRFSRTHANKKKMGVFDVVVYRAGITGTK